MFLWNCFLQITLHRFFASNPYQTVFVTAIGTCVGALVHYSRACCQADTASQLLLWVPIIIFIMFVKHWSVLYNHDETYDWSYFPKSTIMQLMQNKKKLTKITYHMRDWRNLITETLCFRLLNDVELRVRCNSPQKRTVLAQFNGWAPARFGHLKHMHLSRQLSWTRTRVQWKMIFK